MEPRNDAAVGDPRKSISAGCLRVVPFRKCGSGPLFYCVVRYETNSNHQERNTTLAARRSSAKQAAIQAP